MDSSDLWFKSELEIAVLFAPIDPVCRICSFSHFPLMTSGRLLNLPPPPKLPDPAPHHKSPSLASSSQPLSASPPHPLPWWPRSSALSASVEICVAASALLCPHKSSSHQPLFISVSLSLPLVLPESASLDWPNLCGRDQNHDN
ncbi:unnamed protein product [Arabis nemorensis]|uniref:Uncharacterized protein n=1 Tax=Arabis nemorensis TaxID=586526 RepID=A0A565BSU6_9BRAS|nr:unnamed protein product [Arabis nemorensis]